MRKVVFGNITCEVPYNHRFIWVDWYEDQAPEVVTSASDNVFLDVEMDEEKGVYTSFTLEFYNGADAIHCVGHFGLEDQIAMDYWGKLFRILDNGELELIAEYSPI